MNAIELAAANCTKSQEGVFLQRGFLDLVYQRDCTKSQEGVFLQLGKVCFRGFLYCTKSQEGVFLQRPSCSLRR